MRAAAAWLCSAAVMAVAAVARGEGCGCFGCDAGRSFQLGTAASLPARAGTSVRWARRVGAPDAVVECVAAETAAVCGLRGSEIMAAVVAIRGDDGGVEWLSKQLGSSTTYPLIPEGGLDEVVTTSPIAFGGNTLAGDPIGPVISTDLRHASAPASTANGVMVWLRPIFGGGTMVVAYLTDGVPHASLALPGAALAPLCVGDTDRTALFVAVMLNKSACAVYRVNVRRQIDDRLVVAWKIPILCPAEPQISGQLTVDSPSSLVVAVGREVIRVDAASGSKMSVVHTPLVTATLAVLSPGVVVSGSGGPATLMTLNLSGSKGVVAATLDIRRVLGRDAPVIFAGPLVLGSDPNSPGRVLAFVALRPESTITASNITVACVQVTGPQRSLWLFELGVASGLTLVSQPVLLDNDVAQPRLVIAAGGTVYGLG